jgi:hypothetical protein
MKLLLSFFLLLSSTLVASAQVDLLFCTSVESLENCKESEASFPWLGKNTTLKLMIINKDSLKTDRIKYKLYLIKPNNEEVMFAELFITTKHDWLYASKTVYFMQPGYYKVIAYNNDDELLTTGFVQLTP